MTTSMSAGSQLTISFGTPLAHALEVGQVVWIAEPLRWHRRVLIWLWSPLRWPPRSEYRPLEIVATLSSTTFKIAPGRVER